MFHFGFMAVQMFCGSSRLFELTLIPFFKVRIRRSLITLPISGVESKAFRGAVLLDFYITILPAVDDLEQECTSNEKLC